MCKMVKYMIRFSSICMDIYSQIIYYGSYLLFSICLSPLIAIIECGINQGYVFIVMN